LVFDEHSVEDLLGFGDRTLRSCGDVTGSDEGPKKDVGETVAKQRTKDGDGTNGSALPKLPSKLCNENKADTPAESSNLVSGEAASPVIIRRTSPIVCRGSYCAVFEGPGLDRFCRRLPRLR